MMRTKLKSCKLSTVKSKVNSDIHVIVGDKISFLYSGWIVPVYILIGTVVKKEIQGRGGNARFLYTVEVNSQEVFKLRNDEPSKDELQSLLFPEYFMNKFTTKILDQCIKGIEAYSYINTECEVRLYYRYKQVNKC